MIGLAYQSIVTKKGQMGFAKTGNGPALILIVGYSGTLFHWNQQFIDELSQKFTVYMIDNRKIGLSDSNNPESLAGVAQDVMDFIAVMRIEKPFILGWSMGGVIAQEIAISLQDKIAGLILQATVPTMEIVNPDFRALTANSHLYTQDEFRERLYSFFFSEPIDRTSIKANALKLTNYQHYRFTLEAKEFQDRVIDLWPGMSKEDLQSIKIPVLLLWAKNDLTVPQDGVNIFSANLPNPKLIIYPRGGHFLIHINPQQVARDINNFADSIG